MYYRNLLKLTKGGFNISFSLLDKLKITTKEAILLQQIEYINNKSQFLNIPKTILAKITNISKGHLYRCLNKLQKLEFIAITEDGICITQAYKNIKKQHFLEEKAKKSGLNVANSSTTLENEKKWHTQKAQIQALNYVKSGLDNTKQGVIYQNQSIKAKNESFYLKAQYHRETRHDKGIEIMQNSNLPSIKTPKEKAKLQKQIASSTSNKQENVQNRQSFFMQKHSQNETNLSQNETAYNNSNSLCFKHKEFIPSLTQDAFTRLFRFRENLKSLVKLSHLTFTSFNLDSFKDIVNTKFKALIKKQDQIKPSTMLAQCLNKEQTSLLASLMQSMNKSFIFLNAKAKGAFYKDCQNLAQKGLLTKALEYSLNHGKLWITLDSDCVGQEFIRETYKALIAKLDSMIFKH